MTLPVDIGSYALHSAGAKFKGSPWIDVTHKDYGLVMPQDVRVVNDAAMTSGSATLTSATAAFTSGDVGKMAVVIGAGAAGATLIALISTYVNATTVTLASTASSTVSGKAAAFGTDETSKIAAAEADAYAAGVPLYFPPEVDVFIPQALAIRVGVAPGSELALLRYAGSGTALTFGSTTSGVQLFRVKASLPRVWQSLKTVTGWAQAGGADVGVKIINCYECDIWVPHPKNFAVNLQLTSLGTGCVYNRVFPGRLDNGKVNLQYVQGLAGWVNENKVYGGHCFHDSSEGTSVSGTRQIQLLRGDTTYSPPDNNKNLGISVEGNVAEYHVDCHGPYNTFDLRWEATTPKALFTKDADGLATCYRNVIEPGYGASSVVVTQSGGASLNGVRAADRLVMGRSDASNPTAILYNSAANDAPVLLGLLPTIDPYSAAALTDWIYKLTNVYFRGKTSTDAAERILWDFQLGRILYGTGSSTPTSRTPFLSVVTKTANYTATIADDCILVDASGGAVTITLPGAAGMAGQHLVVIKIDSTANAATLDGAGSETINGALTLGLSSQYQAATIVSNGTAWFKVA